MVGWGEEAQWYGGARVGERAPFSSFGTKSTLRPLPPTLEEGLPVGAFLPWDGAEALYTPYTSRAGGQS